MKLFVGFGRRCPVVGRAGFIARFGADEGPLLNTGDVIRIGSMVITTRKLVGSELRQYSPCNRLGCEELLFRFGPVAPEDLGRLTQLSDMPNPAKDVGIAGGTTAGFSFRHGL